MNENIPKNNAFNPFVNKYLNEKSEAFKLDG